MSDVAERASGVQLWRCSCGYTNLGSPRCEACGRKETAAAVATTTVPVLVRPDEVPTRSGSEPIATESRAPLYASPVLVIVVLAIIGGNYAYQHGLASLLSDYSRRTALLVVLLTGLLFYLACWLVSSSVGRALSVRPRFSRSKVQSIALGAGVGGGIGALGAALVFSSQGHAALDPMAAYLIDAGGWVPIVIGVLLIAGVAPLVEEYIFRGLLAESMFAYGKRPALIVSAAAFAAAHLSPVRFSYYFVMGLVLARLYFRQGFLASLTAHAVFNGLVIATAAVVLAAGSGSTVEAAGLRITLPPGWHVVPAPPGDDVAAAGPGSRVLETARAAIPSASSVDVSALVAFLGRSPTFGPASVTGSTARIRATGVGLGAQADLTAGSDAGSVLLLPTTGGMSVVMVHAPAGTDVSNVFDSIVASARPG